MRYLVLGNAQMETITISETGLSREHLGGVGAIMARELAIAGADVTLITTAPEGDATQEIDQAARSKGINPMIFPGNPPQAKRGYAHITTKAGRVSRVDGEWPRMGTLGPHINQVKADWTLVALQLHPRDLAALRKLPGLKAVNATSKKHARLIPQLPDQSVYTMNSGEAKALMQELDLSRQDDLPRALGAQKVMVTQDHNGRVTYTHSQPTQWEDPLPVPKGADFIGCGDAATAGLVFALAEGLDQAATVDQFITGLMERNARGYPASKTGAVQKAHN